MKNIYGLNNMNICSWLLLIIMLVTLASCDKTGNYTDEYEFGVIESMLEKNKSVITYYDKNFRQINQQFVPYGGVSDSFKPGIVYDDKLFLSPEGVDFSENLSASVVIDLKTGEIRRYEHNKNYGGERNYTAYKNKIYVNSNKNHDSYLGYYDVVKNKTKDIKIKNTILWNMIADESNLYSIADIYVSAKQHFDTYLFVFDNESLEIKKKINLHAEYENNFLLKSKENVYFPVTDPEEKQTAKLYKFNTLEHTLKAIDLPEGIHSTSNVIEYENDIYVSSGSAATGKGKELIIYDPESGAIRTHKFRHNLSQIEIKNNKLYALDCDNDNNIAYLYKYKIENDNFIIQDSVRVDTQHGDDYFYIGSFFVK